MDVALEPDGRIVPCLLAGTNSNPTTGVQSFALARFLATGPEIGSFTSFTASPNPVTGGNDVTLTAANISDANPNATITQVAIYLESNGDGTLDAGDTLLGYATRQSDGTWTFTFSTDGWASGTYTLYALAEDSYDVFGDPLALTLTVS